MRMTIKLIRLRGVFFFNGIKEYIFDEGDFKYVDRYKGHKIF